MSAMILDGRRLAGELEARIAARARALTESTGRAPALTAILVGDDPASAVYVRHKQRACERVGVESRLVRLGGRASSHELIDEIQRANADPLQHGILVQLPLPPHLDAREVCDQIDPLKDVDGFHPLNVGLLAQGRPRFVPCTPHGIVQLLAWAGIPVAGRQAVIVGRSDIVGKPLALLLGARHPLPGTRVADATVTLCHSRTADLASWTRQADLLVAAIGQPRAITAEMVRPGATVIDVGINRIGKELIGDVDFAAVAPLASAITPVPGGVGPLTVAMLLDNTLRAAELAATRSTCGCGR